MAIDLKDKRDTLWAYIVQKVEEAMRPSGVLRDVRTFSRSPALYGQPLYPAIATIGRRLEPEVFTESRSEAVYETTFAVLESDFNVENGDETVMKIAYALAELFQGADDWPDIVTRLDALSVNEIATRGQEPTQPEAHVTLAWSFHYLHQ